MVAHTPMGCYAQYTTFPEQITAYTDYYINNLNKYNTIMAYKISKNFTLEEMYSSASAKKYNINNTPSADIQRNIVKLVSEVLQPIRDAWGDSIIVSSGYRCPELNKKVGGATNSDHRFGSAADIHTKSDTVADNKKLFDLICKMAKEGKIKCRQIIDEYNYNWVHVSINHSANSQKNNQVLHIK